MGYTRYSGIYAMTIIEALRRADTDHIVYFLLTAYAESLSWYDLPGSRFPARVTRLPVASVDDVSERVNALKNAQESQVPRPSRARVILEEAIDVFDTASRRLKFLARRASGLARGARAERARDHMRAPLPHPQPRDESR
jgi:hypothetical protein